MHNPNVVRAMDLRTAEDWLGRLGIRATDPSFGGIVRPSDNVMLRGNLIEVVREMFPNATPAQLQRLSSEMSSRISNLESYYAGAFLVERERYMWLPNGATTLRGSGVAGADAAGQTYAAKTVVPLFPAQNGTDSGVPFVFTEEMYFHSLRTGKTDSDNGWYFQGGTVKWSDDVIAGMETDVSFDLFQPEVDLRFGPFGVYRNRCFVSPVNFVAGAVHNRAGAQELIQGVTLTFIDRRCYADTFKAKYWCALEDGSSFGQRVAGLIALHAGMGPGALATQPGAAMYTGSPLAALFTQ